jgi:N utilization substance protein A
MPRSATFIAETLPPLEFGRVAAQNAKQVIVQKVREAERDRQFDEYKDRIGEIANGTVKRVEYGNVIVDLGRAEGIIRRDEMIPRENVRSATASAPTSMTCAASSAARRFSSPARGPSSWRSCSRMEVPEIYDGVVEIKSVARDPGSAPRSRSFPRTRPSIRSAPASACAAPACRRSSTSCRARRSTSSSGTPDAASFVVNALAPAEVTKVVLDEDSNRIEVVVPEASCRSRSAVAARTCGLPRS